MKRLTILMLAALMGCMAIHAEEISQARTYEVLPVDCLPGRYAQDENGFIEFYPEDKSTTDWIMNHLYSVR